MEKGFTSKYKKRGLSIIAKYELDSNYYKAKIRSDNSLTENARQNISDVPYEEQCVFYDAYITFKGENSDFRVFNPFVADFLDNHFDFIEPYEVGYKKGMKHFNETYKVKCPNPEQMDLISKLYNNNFKKNILCISTVLNEETIKQIGFENGILSAYAEYEKSYLELFLNNSIKALPPQPIVKSPFSVIEWATIFYYADETKLLSDSRFLKTRMEQFIKDHEIDTTFKYFRNQYYEAKRRINEKNDYPINKLELIIPFLKENYIQAVAKVENDITFLKNEQSEY